MKNNDRCFVSGGDGGNRITSWILLREGRQTQFIVNTYSYSIYNPYYYYYIHTIFCVFGYRERKKNGMSHVIR